MYAIKINENGRVLHATRAEFVTNVETESGVVEILEGYVIVNELPNGNCYDYIFDNGNYVYNPVPVIPDEPAPGDLSLEERVAALEKAIPAPAEYSPGKWYYRGDRVTFNGSVYICIAPEGVACVWSPTEYPAYWQKG